MRVALLILAAAPLFAEGPSLANGDLRAWEAGAPVGWTLGVGAGRGEPASVVEPVEGGGLAVRGDASTQAWRSVSQPFEAHEGDPTFEAGVKELARRIGK